MKQPVSGLVIATKYRLEKALASGGMGSVWVARHIELDSLVAIKFITAGESSDARGRFQREAKAAARIQSPNIVRVQDYGVDDELPYIVMELLKGEDLATRLKRRQRLTLEQTFAILVQVAKALRRTHDEGIIHRDLKPGNIFIVAGSEDEDEVVKIVDFGIAKGTGPFLTGDNTTTGNVMGSPGYMSPEQVRGLKDIDGRSDLWSLGVILFRALAGRLPFVSDVPSDLFVQIATAPIPVATSIEPDLPPSVDAFFARALERDTTRRFQTAREMVEAFAQLIGPSAAGRLTRSSIVSPPPKGASRPRRVAAAVLALTLASIGGVVISTRMTSASPSAVSPEAVSGSTLEAIPSADEGALPAATATATASEMVGPPIASAEPSTAPRGAASATVGQGSQPGRVAGGAKSSQAALTASSPAAAPAGSSSLSTKLLIPLSEMRPASETSAPLTSSSPVQQAPAAPAPTAKEEAPSPQPTPTQAPAPDKFGVDSVGEGG